MKILTYSPLPFSLAHGGVTNICNKTTEILIRLGYEVEPLMWWDSKQIGDILFCFCRPDNMIVDFAKSKGMKIVIEQVLTGLVSRPLWKRRIQKIIKLNIETCAPAMISEAFGWRAFKMADFHFVPSLHDARVLNHMFDVPMDRIRVLPYGVDDEFLEKKLFSRENYLVCTSTITERKRVVELTLGAIRASVPLWVVGKTYSENDPYGTKFRELVSNSGGLIRHIPHVDGRKELAKLLCSARGFVLLSTMETVSQSALEAAACGCPMMLSDLDWAKAAFGDNATYCPVTESVEVLANKISEFYRDCPRIIQSFESRSWWDARKDVLADLKNYAN